MSSCLFYDKRLNKPVPCFIIPTKIYSDAGNIKTVGIHYDRSKFQEFSVTQQELYRYSTDRIRIKDLYPNTNQEEYDYAMACFPNQIANASTYKTDELKRFRKIINIILDGNNRQLSYDMYIRICDFVSYDILFTTLDQIDRGFMKLIANFPLTNENITGYLAMFGGQVPSKLFVKLCNDVLTTHQSDFVNYSLQNNMNLTDVSVEYNLTFPININLHLLTDNAAFLEAGGYLVE
jgi:hypothetical protein